MLKRSTNPIACSRLIRLFQREGVPHDVAFTAVGVASRHVDFSRADQLTTVLFGQGEVVQHVHEETADGRAVLRTVQDGHVDAVDGHVIDDVVQRHGDVVVGAVTRERCSHHTVVTAVLEVRHVKALGGAVVAWVLVLGIRREQVVQGLRAQSVGLVRHHEGVVGCVAQRVEGVGRVGVAVDVQVHHDGGLVCVTHVVHLGTRLQILRNLALRPCTVLVEAGLEVVGVAQVVVDARVVLRRLVHLDVVDFPRVAPGSDPTETHPNRTLLTGSFRDVKLEDGRVVRLVARL